MMYSSWHTLMYAFLKKCYRKADHLPQPFLGSTYLSEPCMCQIAYSCTLALYVGPWRLYRRVWRQFEGSYSRKYCMDVCLCTYMFRPCIYIVHMLYRHVHTMYMVILFHCKLACTTYTSIACRAMKDEQASLKNTVWMYVRVHVQTMYIPCTYMACTISLCYEQKIHKRPFMQISSFEPTIMCIAASCLNH